MTGRTCEVPEDGAAAGNRGSTGTGVEGSREAPTGAHGMRRRVSGEIPMIGPSIADPADPIGRRFHRVLAETLR